MAVVLVVGLLIWTAIMALAWPFVSESAKDLTDVLLVLALYGVGVYLAFFTSHQFEGEILWWLVWSNWLVGHRQLPFRKKAKTK